MRNNKIQVLVVCGTGTFCSALVQTTLEEHCKSAGTLGQLELHHSAGTNVLDSLDGIDFIATTVELPDGIELPVLDAYKLLYDEDTPTLARFDELFDEARAQHGLI